MRLAAIRALEIRGEAAIIRSMSHGELEARILEAERSQVVAPPDVSRQPRLTAQAEADAWQQSANAATCHDHAGSANAKRLAAQLAAERQQLEATDNRYEQWSAATVGTREAAEKAGAELTRRGSTRKPTGPPQPHATKEPEAGNSVDPGADYEDRTVGTPIGHLIAQVGSAAARIADQRAECEARKEYAARIERETQAQPEHTRETQPPGLLTLLLTDGVLRGCWPGSFWCYPACRYVPSRLEQ